MSFWLVLVIVTGRNEMQDLFVLDLYVWSSRVHGVSSQ